MAAILEELYDNIGRVDMAAVAEMTGEPIARLAQMTPLTAGALRKNPTSERAQPAARRFVGMFASAARLLGSRKAALIWLRTPHPELENHSPLDLLYDQRFEAVEGLVHDLRSGAPG
ncbi:MAG: DUF2384 domain-containing protein [Candidatus Eremiobacteraeota bacterium]|nr:DUF2384 domain-containing protein [Candidatus Eremiobacteraeota bacterium]